MARSRRGGGGGGSFRRPAAPARRAAPASPRRPASTQAASQPPKTTAAPMKQQQSQSQPPATTSGSGGGMLSGIGSTIAQGMAFGTGSAIAHRAVGAAAGAMSGSGDDVGLAQPSYDAGAAPADAMQQQQQLLEGPCASDKQMFFECLQVNRGDQEACSFLYESLQQCQRNENTMSFH